MKNMRLLEMLESGHSFISIESELRYKFQILNLAIILSNLALLFGILVNSFSNNGAIIIFESFLIVLNLFLFSLLRKGKRWLGPVSQILTIQFSLLFLAFIYFYEPNELKFIWVFTFPIILLFFQSDKNTYFWIGFMIVMIMILPMQTLVQTEYSYYQAGYLSFGFFIISLFAYFYKVKMQEVIELSVRQQNQLQSFNTELELKVEQKTAELQDLNEMLESRVQEKVKELIAKDELLTSQSKLAVMGEMISMIAHQWKQPLSNISLTVTDLQFKRLLKKEISQEKLDEILNEINETVLYLSSTIDDFQKYFRPDKQVEQKDICAIIDRVLNLIKPRLRGSNIELLREKEGDIFVETYENEITQVLLNILNNAIDAFEENNVDKPKLSLWAKEKGGIVFIYIKDNAGGISPEIQTQIFEPYFSTKGKNGTGLGLYMSQMIVEKQFHGEIKVDSSEGETTFIIEIDKKLS